MWGILKSGLSLELSCVKGKKTHLYNTQGRNSLPDIADNKVIKRNPKIYLANVIQKNSEASNAKKKINKCFAN